MEQLCQKDYLIILALESDPLMSIETLTKKVNYPISEVKERYEKICANGIIRVPRAFTESEQLGLQRIAVIAICNDFDSLGKLELACDYHPYTKYRSRFFGREIGLYMQFDIPANETADRNFDLFFRILKNHNIVRSVKFYKSLGIRHEVFPDLNKYNIDTASWEYRWEDWFINLVMSKNTNLPLPKEISSDFSEFTPLKFDTLAELTSNASLRPSYFEEKLQIGHSEAVDSYEFVKANYIRNIRQSFNRDAFDLTEAYMFIISDVSIKQQAALFSNLENNPPPFNFAMEVLESNKVLLWGNMSVAQSNSFLYKLWNQYPNLNVLQLNTRDTGAKQYYFYPPNFDFIEMKWKVSEEYMVDEPLTSLGLMK